MLGGVAIFSSVLGDFIEMFDVIKDIQEDYQEFSKLNQFFGLIKNFNRGNEIDLDLRKEIERYFEYRWFNYKNLALGEDDKDVW